MKKTFSVEGMSCAACVAHVEKAVAKTAGVKNVNVNLLMNNMVVEYDEKVCSPTMIENSVSAAGYSAKLADGGSEFGKSGGINVSSDGGDDGGAASPSRKKLDRSLAELIASGVLLIALMYFSMGNMMCGFPSPGVFDHKTNPIGYALIQLLLLAPILIIYKRYFINGFRNLFRGAPNMDTLIAIGASVSVLYGIVSIFILSYYTSLLSAVGLTEVQISAYKSIIATYHDNLYFESAGMILTLVSLGKYLEGLSKRKTTKAVESLAKLKPTRAVVLKDGIEQEVNVDEVKVGDIVVVKRGANIPVDGVLQSGTVSADQANITGESVPVVKNVGDEVYASTTVTAGYATVKATKVGEDTSFSAIIKLVEEAASSKAPVSRLADKISGVFVPVILVIGLLTFICNMLAGSSLELSLNFAVTVIVIACPCALGLATPVAIMVGTGKAAQLGLIIRNAEILERTKSINVVVFDKTGTITQGKPTVTDFKADKDGKYYLNVAYSLENMSEHPLALAVCEYAANNNAELIDVKNYSSTEGRGVYGEVNDKKYCIGNLALAKEKSDNSDKFAAAAEAFAAEGKTPLFLIENNKTVGLLAVKDKVKETAESAVNELIARDIDVIMLTGDNKKTACAVADEVGIKNVISDVLPQDKQRIIESLKGEGKVVAMVGDGVNDAPALTAADIGIAIGGGSDVAVNSGDIVLLKNDLSGVPVAVDLSKHVLFKIKLGLFWAFFYNVICVFIATGIPYYLFNFKISPMIGALAMSFSSVSVVLNALSVNLFKPKHKIKRGIARQNTVKCEISDLQGGQNMVTVLKVKGMMCGHCVMHVEKAASSVDGVVYAKSDIEKGQVTIEHNGADINAVKQKIVDAGYEVE